MTAIPYEFLAYTIKPIVMRVLPDLSPSPIYKISEWIVLKNGEQVATGFRTSQHAEEWIKQQS